MYHVNQNVQVQQIQHVQEAQNFSLSNNVEVDVTFLNEQGLAVKTTYVAGKSGSTIGNSIKDLVTPANYTITGYEYNGNTESLSQIENIKYVQGQENNIVIEIKNNITPTQIMYNINGGSLIENGKASITANSASISLMPVVLRGHHVTSVEINGQTFTDVSVAGNIVNIKGSIPSSPIGENYVLINFAQGAEASQVKHVVKKLTGWQEINGERYYYNAEGKKLTGWHEVDGLSYCFNQTTGVQETGIQETPYGLEYFAGNPALGEGKGSAIYYTGWLNLNGKRYYFNRASKAVTGWHEIDGLSYYFNPKTGVQETGIKETPYGLEYFAGNPALGEGEGSAIYYTGWLKLDGKKYYFQSSSKAATGWHTIDGHKYYFNQDGVLTV